MSLVLLARMYGFQSTRPRGARLVGRRNPSGGKNRFNPRARGGRDKRREKRRKRRLEFQSTRPRGARHKLIEPGAPTFQVSIHAPAGGATKVPAGSVVDAIVSIHAPAGGATLTC